MNQRIPVGLLLLLSLIYIGFGDQFLPASIGRYSFQARSSIDQMLIGAFPTWRPKVDPSRRTEEALEKTEKGEVKR
jgi:hypothetical protein